MVLFEAKENVSPHPVREDVESTCYHFSLSAPHDTDLNGYLQYPAALTGGPVAA